MYVHADVTAVFPWVTYALMSDPKRTRPYRRLYDHRATALEALDEAVALSRDELLKTIDYAPVTEALAIPATAPTRARKKKG